MRARPAFITWIGLLLALLMPRAQALTLYMGQDSSDSYAYLIANDVMLEVEDAHRMRRFLSQQSKKGLPTVIFLTSQGGYAELMGDYARAMIEPSNDLYRRRGLFNIVVVNEECSSACIILMSQLTSRRDAASLKIMVLPEAKFGFHSPVEVVNGRVREIRDLTERELRIKKQVDLMIDGGVNAKWLEANDALVRSFGMTYLSGQQLCADGSNILPADSCVQGTNDLATLAANQMNSAILLAQGARNKTAQTARATETLILERMGSRPAAATPSKPSKDKKR